MSYSAEFLQAFGNLLIFRGLWHALLDPNGAHGGLWKPATPNDSFPFSFSSFFLPYIDRSLSLLALLALSVEIWNLCIRICWDICIKGACWDNHCLQHSSVTWLTPACACTSWVLLCWLLCSTEVSHVSVLHCCVLKICSLCADKSGIVFYFLSWKWWGLLGLLSKRTCTVFEATTN